MTRAISVAHALWSAKVCIRHPLLQILHEFNCCAFTRKLDYSLFVFTVGDNQILDLEFTLAATHFDVDSHDSPEASFDFGIRDVIVFQFGLKHKAGFTQSYISNLTCLSVFCLKYLIVYICLRNWIEFHTPRLSHTNSTNNYVTDSIIINGK